MFKDGINLQDNSIHSFLMIGQSNMAGRGEFNEVEEIKNDKCYMLRMGRWQPMSEPICPDRPIFKVSYHSGIGLAASFADSTATEFGIRVGLIPCADGGTKMSQWMPGTILYDHALMMAKLAQRSSKLSGILWHQGESDCLNDEDTLKHKDMFISMINTLRNDLGNPDLPVIIGELSYNITGWDVGDRAETINKQYREITNEIPFCNIASSEGFTLKRDGLHFDSPSLRIFGRRYFEAYKKIITKTIRNN